MRDRHEHDPVHRGYRGCERLVGVMVRPQDALNEHLALGGSLAPEPERVLLT